MKLRHFSNLSIHVLFSGALGEVRKMELYCADDNILI